MRIAIVALLMLGACSVNEAATRESQEQIARLTERCELLTRRHIATIQFARTQKRWASYSYVFDCDGIKVEATAAFEVPR